MKKIMKIFVVAALVLTAASCVKENPDNVQNTGGTSENLVPMTITASREADTKAALQADGKVFWEAGDAMTVLAVSTEGETETVSRYEFTTDDSGVSAEFTGLVDETTLTLSEGMYCVYPPTNENWHPYLYYQALGSDGKYGYTGFNHTVSSGVLQMFMSSTQFASENYSKIHSLSAGVVADDKMTLVMKNVGGLIALTLPSQNIRSVILYGNSGEMIAGRVSSAFDENGVPAVTEVLGSNMIRLIPSTANVSFSAGTYYINVPPMTFDRGLTLLFIDSDNKYATVRSSDAFVVERSKISELPAITNLKFAGKVVELIYSDDYIINKGNAKPLKRDSNGDGEYKEDLYVSATRLTEPQTMYDGTYYYTANAKYVFHNAGDNGGLCIGRSAGNYLTIPVIEGYTLNKVSVRSGLYNYGTASGLCVTTKPDTDGNYTLLPNCTPWPGNVEGGMEYIWSFSGETGGEYALTLTTTPSSQDCRMQVIRMFYSEVGENGSSITPLITEIKTGEPIVDYSNMKLTLNGSFAAIDYSSISQFTCGFDYKLSSASDWSSVTSSDSSFGFTSEIELETRGNYVYRSWVKFVKADGSVKTVYGEEGEIDFSKVVFELVFTDSYWDKTADGRNANFLVREWGWSTNQNNSDMYKTALSPMNGKSYDFVYNGVGYPFTFYSLQGVYYDKEGTSTLSPGGYTLRVASGSKTTYGLCMNYINEDITPLDAYPAWMQFPGIEGFRLAQVKTVTYSRNGYKIASDVVTDENAAETVLGTAKEDCVIAEATSTYNATLDLSGTKAGQRYYLCTTQGRLTFKNLTLTYEYAGE